MTQISSRSVTKKIRWIFPNYGFSSKVSSAAQNGAHISSDHGRSAPNVLNGNVTSRCRYSPKMKLTSRKSVYAFCGSAGKFPCGTNQKRMVTARIPAPA